MCVLEEKEKNLGAQTAFVKLQHRGESPSVCWVRALTLFLANSYSSWRSSAYQQLTVKFSSTCYLIIGGF